MPGVEESWPWPNVRGKRCLALGATDLDLGAALAHRGAAEVAERASLATLEPDRVGAFDIVVAVGVLSEVDDPAVGADALASVSGGMLLSAERIDLRMSLLQRGGAWVDPLESGSAFNGAGHKQVLVDAGFAIERVGRPYTHGSVRPTTIRLGGEYVHRLALRALTGSWSEGELHRALLARRCVR